MRILTITAALTLASLAATALNADARKRRGPHKGNIPTAKKGLNFAELGAIRDKFESYKRLIFGGAGFYTKANPRLRAAHTKTYHLIRNSLVEERINEDQGRNATAELIKIGQEAKRLRGDTDALNENDAKSISAKIKALAARIRKARINEVNPDTLTARINKRQAHFEELFLFVTDNDIASKGQTATLRRHLTDLEKKEDRAKNDNKVSDRERKKLVEKTHDVWKAFVRVLKP